MSWQRALTLLIGIAMPAMAWFVDGGFAQESLPPPKEIIRQASDRPAAMLAHSGYHTVAFSPDGKRLAAASRNCTLKVWEAATGRELLSLPAGQSDLIDVAYSPDGKWLAASSREGVRVWDAATGKEAIAIRGIGTVNRLTFTPDSRRLATAGTVNISIWDLANGQEITRHIRAHCAHVSSVVFGKDGARMASGSTDKTIKLWDVANNQESFVLAGHTGAVHTVAFSPDGKCLASASMDRTIKIWLTPADIELLTLTGHTGGVHAVAYSPDGRHLASGSADKTVRVWNLQTGRTVLVLEGHTGPVYGVVFSPDGRQLASTGGDCSVKRWDLPLAGPELVRLSVDELENAWCDLAGGDVVDAYRASVSLSASPGQTLPLIRERVLPVEADAADSARLARLIAELDAHEFTVREKAADELEQMGRSACPALLRALESQPSLEVAHRMQRLLERNHRLPGLPEQVFAERITDVLERIGNPESRYLLRRLADGLPDAWLTHQARTSLQRQTKRE